MNQNKNKDASKDDKIQATFKYLKLWIKKQPHLPNCDENIIKHVAAASKGNNEKASKKLDGYFTIRSLLPEFFSPRDPLSEELERTYRNITVTLLPGLTTDGCRVLMIYLPEEDIAFFEPVPIIRRIFMLIDLLIKENDFNPGQGIYFLMDIINVHINHILKFTPPMLRKCVFCLQDVYPLSIKGFIYVNINEVLRVAITTLIMPFFKQKMRKRFHFYGNKYDKIYSTMPKEILPLELSGNATSYREISDSARQQFISHKTWFTNDGSVKSDESKRIGECPISAPGCSIM